MQEPRISEVLNVVETGIGPLSGVAVELIGEAPATTPDDPNLISKHMYYSAFGNQETNTLYIIWFESPADAWEDAWVHEPVMLENMAVDPRH